LLRRHNAKWQLLAAGLGILVVLALLVPFFLWVSQVPLSQALEPSFAWRAVQWFWESILKT